jgi:16S rRNA processing protein RimM
LSSSSDASARLEVGRVARAHGIQGAVKVALHWTESPALDDAESVWLTMPNGTERELSIESLSEGGRKQLVVKFKGVKTRNDAEALQGARVSVERRLLPALAPGEYYLVDLIGARVLGPDGPIGEVVDIAVHPSIDSILVRTADGKVQEQPLSAPWLVRVDTQARVIELSGTDGFIA